ncbi:hypothetical protein [Roseomonas xinghualingensis]|uniref:hypothetical protein n=1 Tax=Roseomonas xinghualingensis TaxID=2986475 RepID=UPI0021F225E0|nr:hypothetical protein [Roseomonas sp. SXEYE001]MCV4208119.1 hypothetical protein [Roseomonas sp. SXEYE001]
MRRTALALAILAVPAIMPALAQSPAQRQAQQKVERDQQRDRVAEAARNLETGGAATTPALVDDMNRERPTLEPDRPQVPANNPRARAQTTLPLLSDNPQR